MPAIFGNQEMSILKDSEIRWDWIPAKGMPE